MPIMNLLDTDRSVLFIRVPKCGSTYVRKHLVETILRGKKMIARARQDPKNIAWLDFRRPQLEELVSQKNVFVATEFFTPLGTTYNRHHPHWIPEQARSEDEARDLFTRFKGAGWFIFTFLRHPGDLLCSMYHYGRDTAKTNRWYFKYAGNVDRHFYWFNPEETLDEFIGRDPSPLPRLYFDPQAVDSILPFSPGCFSDFSREYFAVSMNAPTPENKSSNQGYSYYCGNGLISTANQNRIRESGFAKVYGQLMPSPM